MTETLAKRQWLETSRQLNKALVLCEKDKIFKHLESLELREEAASLQQLDLEYEKQRKKIEESFCRVLASLKTNVKEIVGFVEKKKPGKRHLYQVNRSDVDQLRQLMEAVESEITNFHQRYSETLEALNNDGVALESELEDFLQETQCWDDPSSENQLTQKPQEVSKYEKFVAEHGRYGGWNDNDHVMFVQILTKYTSKKGEDSLDNDFIHHVCRLVPHWDPSSVQQHLTWYRKYSDLSQKNRVAIQHWKETKSLDSGNVEVHNKPPKMQSQSKEKLKTDVEEWKKKKEEAKRAEEEARKTEIQQREETEKKRQLMLEKHRQRQKEALARYHEEKAEREAFLQLVEDINSNASLPVKPQVPLTTFQDKDKEFLKQRQKQIVTKKEKAAERERKVEQLLKQTEPVNVPRDPNRILKPTEAFQHAQQAPQEEKTIFKPLQVHPKPILKIRAVPAWRNGV